MTFFESLSQSITLLLILVLLAVLLKRFKVITEEHASVFAGLITNFTLPAIIFSALSQHHFSVGHLKLMGVMMGAECVCLAIGWFISTAMKLSRPQTGTVMLACAFGSSAFVGFALVLELFSGNNQAISDAIVISELGVGSAIFTLGILVAMWFGNSASSGRRVCREAATFLYSPIFIAIVLGIVFSFSSLPKNIFTTSLYKLFDIIGCANTLLVGLTVGAILKLQNLKKALPLILIACAVKLLVEPGGTLIAAKILDFPPLWKKLIVLEAAMPVASLVAVFSKRYGCDAPLAGQLVFASLLFSLATTMLMMSFV